MKTVEEVKRFCENISCHLMGTWFNIRVERDCKDPLNGRIFIQMTYKAFCSKTGVMDDWSGRKLYLSEHMTEDEIVKTCYTAFESAVKHEVMEGFKVGGITVFNPHIYYQELIKVSHKEVFRKQKES